MLIGVVARQRLKITRLEITVAAREFPFGKVDYIALVVERVWRFTALPASAFAQLVGDFVGVDSVTRVEVNVPRNQELARSDSSRTAARIEFRRPRVRLPLTKSLCKPFVFTSADTCQIAELR